MAAVENYDSLSHYGRQYYRLRIWVTKDVLQVLAGASPNQIEGRFLPSLTKVVVRGGFPVTPPRHLRPAKGRRSAQTSAVRSVSR